MTLLLREADVRELLTMENAIKAVRSGFELLAKGGAQNYPRRRGGNDGAVINVMWAVAPDLGILGVKAYPVVRTDVSQGATSTLLLYGLPEGRLVGILEADVLGQIRTGGASALATTLMARSDARTLTVFGAGWQAEAQVTGITHVLPGLRQILVVSRSPDRSRGFIERLRERLDLAVDVTDARSAVEAADVIATATGATEPVFRGEWLRPGTHVNAIGSNYAEKREIDRVTLDRAAIVAVDSLEVARLESGDLIRNDFAWDTAIEFADVVTGAVEGRTNDEAITVFESHGLAIQDVVCGQEVMRLAAERSVGMPMPLA